MERKDIIAILSKIADNLLRNENIQAYTTLTLLIANLNVEEAREKAKELDS